MPYLMKETRTHTEEAVRHGGCLGLGLAAMGTADEGGWSIGVEGCQGGKLSYFPSPADTYDLLKDCLSQDDAVVGQSPLPFVNLNALILPPLTSARSPITNRPHHLSLHLTPHLTSPPPLMTCLQVRRLELEWVW